MRIAVVHPSLAIRGGAENVVVWLAAELARRGHEVTVITTAYDTAFFGSPQAHGFRLLTGAFGGYDVHPLMHLRAGWRLRTALAGFDWVNPHNFPSYHWVFWARMFNPRVGPVVWFCEEPVRGFYPEICNPHLRLRQPHEPTPPRQSRPWWGQRVSLPSIHRRLQRWKQEWQWKAARWMDRRIVPRLDLILANSEFIAAQVRTIFGVPASACLLGIPPDRFARFQTEAPPPYGRYLLTVSRLHPEKNVETMLVAVALLRTRGVLPFDRYVVAGDGPLRGALRARAEQLGINDIVTFLGFVQEEDLATLYRHATLVVYLPLDETYGLVFPEAGLWRKAVIGPDHGGPSEIIRHGETGILVDALDPAAVADAIESCLGRPDLLDRLGEEGRRYTTTELTVGRFADRFERRLVERRGSRG